MKTISIINLKGGVAKTISAVNIAHILATVHGKRVLLIDNDKQGNTSKLFGQYDPESETTLAEVLTGKITIEEAIFTTEYENIHIIPSNLNLLNADKEILLGTETQQARLLKALINITGNYDYCIIDNAPDMEMSTLNGLVAADQVMVPVKIDQFAFEGLDLISEQINQAKEYNPNLKLLGCFITMYQRNTVNNEGIEWLKGFSGYPTFQTVIRKTTKVDESTFKQMPLLEYAPKSTAAKDYLALVEEYLKK